MLLFYIRHGDPVYDPDSLTPLGERQAEALAKRLAVHGIDRIYASTSNRAYKTAAPTAALTEKEIIEVDFFNEKHAFRHFSLTGADGKKRWIEAIREYRPLLVGEEMYALGDRWYEHPLFCDGRFKEGSDFFTRSIDNFMLDLGYEHDRKTRTYKAHGRSDERVAIFAHGGFGGVFLSSILDIPYPQFVARQSMSHTGVTVIRFDSEGDNIVPEILQFGNDSHLYKEGLPTLHCNEIPI